MIRFLIQSVLSILGNVVGLLVASMVVPGFSVNASGFLVSILFFTIAQIILGPFVLKMAVDYMPALRGGIALATTLLVLLLTSWLTNGIVIEGLTAWVIAPLVIWLASILAGILLPMVLFKKTLEKKTEE